METIGDRIKYAREKKGISQKQLATKVGLSQPSLAYIESGITKIPRKIQSIADALDVSKEWLLVGGEFANDDVVEKECEIGELKRKVKRLEFIVDKLLDKK